MILIDKVRAGKQIVRYHSDIWYKRCAGRFHPALRRRPSLESYPAVTILVTTHNCRYPLELTLRSLRQNTAYPNYQILVAHNASTDGTVEFVRELEAEGWPICLINHERAEPQWWWYDKMLKEVDTPYWIGLHQDMYFLSGDWLLDLVYRMEMDKDVRLLSGERVPPRSGVREPVKGAIVDVQEKPSTWIFCARKELRNEISTSWKSHKWTGEDAQSIKIYEQGGRLIEDMRTTNIRYDWMPSWYSLRYQHIGNLSWVFRLDRTQESVRFYKLYQIRDMERRVKRLRSVET